MDDGKVAAEQTPAEVPMFAGEVSTQTKAHSSIPQEEVDRLTRDIMYALKTVYDPEIPVDIYELGLIYRIDIAEDRSIDVEMTLTAPGCPVAGEMPGWVEGAISTVQGVGAVSVRIVFDPPWTPDLMSDTARIMLDWY